MKIIESVLATNENLCIYKITSNIFKVPELKDKSVFELVLYSNKTTFRMPKQ